MIQTRSGGGYSASRKNKRGKDDISNGGNTQSATTKTARPTIAAQAGSQVRNAADPGSGGGSAPAASAATPVDLSTRVRFRARRSPRGIARREAAKKALPKAPTSAEGLYFTGKEKTLGGAALLSSKSYAQEYVYQRFKKQAATGSASVSAALAAKLMGIAKAHQGEDDFFSHADDGHDLVTPEGHTVKRLSSVVYRVSTHGTGAGRPVLPDPPGRKAHHDRGHAATLSLVVDSLHTTVNGLVNLWAEHGKINQGPKVGYERALKEVAEHGEARGIEVFSYHAAIYRDHDKRTGAAKVSNRPMDIIHIAFTKDQVLAAFTFTNQTGLLGTQCWGR